MVDGLVEFVNGHVGADKAEMDACGIHERLTGGVGVAPVRFFFEVRNFVFGDRFREFLKFGFRVGIARLEQEHVHFAFGSFFGIRCRTDIHHQMVAHKNGVEVEQFKFVYHAVEQALHVIVIFTFFTSNDAFVKVVQVDLGGDVFQNIVKFVVVALVQRLRIGQVSLN